MKENGAYFYNISGWESPAWFAINGNNDIYNDNPEYYHENTFHHRPKWFPLWKNEHECCRNHVVLFDMTFVPIFLIQGHNATSFVNRIATSKIEKNNNNDNRKIKYTQFLNERGYMEADVTIVNFSDNTYLVIVTDTMHNHTYNHMIKHINNDKNVCITDITGRYTQLNIQGPKSKDLIQSITSYNMNQIQFNDFVEIDIDIALCYCARISYMGELGYELYIPVEQSHIIYNAKCNAGNKFNLHHAGIEALTSLRLEKGYRDYGHDMDNSDTIVQCGLSFTCNFDKTIPFIGQDAVIKEKELMKENGGLYKRMVSVLVNDPEPLLHGGEVLWYNGKPFTDIRSGSYGHTLCGAVGLAMLDNNNNGHVINKSFLNNANWEVEIADKKYSCQVSLRPFYDPSNERIHPEKNI